MAAHCRDGFGGGRGGGGGGGGWLVGNGGQGLGQLVAGALEAGLDRLLVMCCCVVV